MRIILSRKGFDAGNVGVPSPIFPSDEMRSLPIPQPASFPLCTPIGYQQIAHNGRPLANIVSDLTGGRVAPKHAAHLDPDLDTQSLPRAVGWRPVFGQNEAAESHLRNQQVQAGDVFLFFGWFRRVEQVAGRYCYVSNAPNLHVIFGWLQIEERIPLSSRSAIPGWAHYHPHFQMKDPKRAGSLYLSTPCLALPGLIRHIPGSGVFPFSDALRLTAPGQRFRSIWRLPVWFYPSNGKPPLSYHESLARWRLNGNDVELQSASRGQEFVLDCGHYPEAIPWLIQLLS